MTHPEGTGPLGLEEVNYGSASETLHYVKSPDQEYGPPRPVRRFSMQEKTILLVEIFALQREEGGIELNEKVAAGLGLDLREIRRVSRKIKTVPKGSRTVLVHTALIYSVLEAHFKSDAEMWQQVFAKTTNWLDRVLGKGIPAVAGLDLFDWAKLHVQEKVRI